MVCGTRGQQSPGGDRHCRTVCAWRGGGGQKSWSAGGACGRSGAPDPERGWHRPQSGLFLLNQQLAALEGDPQPRDMAQGWASSAHACPSGHPGPSVPSPHGSRTFSVTGETLMIRHQGGRLSREREDL